MLRRALLPLAIVVMAPSARAGIDGQVLVGVSSTNWSYIGDDGNTHTKGVSGTAISASFGISPLPLPISFGITVNTLSYDIGTALKAANFAGDNTGYDVSAAGKLTGLTYGPEIIAWLPVPWIKPYLRLGYLLGSYQETNTLAQTAQSGYDSGQNFTDSTTIKSTSSGSEIGVGLRFTPLPLVGFLIEYQHISEVHKLKTISDTLNGAANAVDISSLPGSYRNQSFAAGTVRLGLQVGI